MFISKDLIKTDFGFIIQRNKRALQFPRQSPFRCWKGIKSFFNILFVDKEPNTISIDWLKKYQGTKNKQKPRERKEKL